MVAVALTFVAIKVWFSGQAARGLGARVLAFERAATSSPGAVHGVVENQSRRLRHSVRVELELLNGRGDVMWVTTAFAPILSPNQSWSFRTSVIDPNAVTARVSRVQAWAR